MSQMEKYIKNLNQTHYSNIFSWLIFIMWCMNKLTVVFLKPGISEKVDVNESHCKMDFQRIFC